MMAIRSKTKQITSKKTEIADILIYPFISYPENSPIKYLVSPYFLSKEINVVLNSRSSETIIQYVQPLFVNIVNTYRAVTSKQAGNHGIFHKNWCILNYWDKIYMLTFDSDYACELGAIKNKLLA